MAPNDIGPKARNSLLLGIGKTTIQQWEQGVKKPGGAAKRLLDVIKRRTTNDKGALKCAFIVYYLKMLFKIYRGDNYLPSALIMASPKSAGLSTT